MTLDALGLSRPSHLPEAMLERGYGLSEARPCACGGAVNAVPEDHESVVRAIDIQGLSTQHRRWRAREIAAGRLVDLREP